MLICHQLTFFSLHGKRWLGSCLIFQQSSNLGRMEIPAQSVRTAIAEKNQVNENVSKLPTWQPMKCSFLQATVLPMPLWYHRAVQIVEQSPPVNGAHSGHRPAKFSRQGGQCSGELELFWKQLRKRLIFNLILSQEDMLSLRRRCDMLQCSLCTLRGPGDLTSSHREASTVKWSMNLAFGFWFFFPSMLSRRWSLFSICLEWTLPEAGTQTGKTIERSRDKG